MKLIGKGREMNKEEEEVLEEWELENGEEPVVVDDKDEQEQEEDDDVQDGDEEEEEDIEGLISADFCREDISLLSSDAKRALVGAGARVLFYPTLMYNVVRNKLQSEFHWWDQIDQFILLGAVPFPTDVPRLKQLGVHGVVTLNESYETLVPTSLYHAHDINHLVIPTRDYLFAPAFEDICQAVDFIHDNASNGKKTYVHCKAGRGRSTTIVLCYLVQHNQMTPDAAYKYVRSIRPRVLLASAQWKAVQEFYLARVVNNTEKPCCTQNLVLESARSSSSEELAAFEDGSVLVVTESDLDGYESLNDSTVGDVEKSIETHTVHRDHFSTTAALEKLSNLWLQKMPEEKMSRKDNCIVEADQLGGLGSDISVY